MDILLLGAAAIVLIALTVWIVSRPATAAETPGGAVQAEEGPSMLPPQGDKFEDQYTSATADLSAGGVAVTEAQAQEPEVSDFQRSAEPWSDPELAHAGPPLAMPAAAPQPALPEPSREQQIPRTIGVGAAAALTVAGAAAGAWLYARWQKQRDKPLNRLRRKFK